MHSMIAQLTETKTAPGDYTGEDGLLHCGKCRTPKQIRLEKNPFTGESVPTIVPTPCRCQQEADQAAEDRDRRERFRLKMSQMNSDGISCPGALRHTFADDDGQNPEITAVCKRYVESWDEMARENIGILFCSSIGVGKSFYSACVANALLEKRVPTAATSFPRLLNLLQGAQDKQKLLDSLSRYKLLIFDDLGVERNSAFGMEQIFNIIDARRSSELPVIVTTNLTLNELEHPASMQYARIYDRVLEICPIQLRLTGNSRRTQNAEKRKELAQKILLG